jgi:acetyl esterase/lipase
VGGREAQPAHAATAALRSLSSHASGEPPTFVVVGENDGIAPPATMKRRVEALRRAGTEVEYREYQRLCHGFGLGVGTRAEGWIVEALQFWERSTKRRSVDPKK